MKSRIRLLPLMLFLPSSLVAQPPAGKPQIAFEARAAVAIGVSPGGEVAWFAVAREPAEFNAVIVRREAVIADEDGDGKVRFEIDKPVPFRSIWVAVDLVSGEFALATPADYPLRELRLNPNAFRSGRAGRLEAFGEGREFLQLFAARPGVGAWVATVFDGSPEDQDGPTNLSVEARLSDMDPIQEGPPPPDAFATGDVFVVIDPNQMEAAAVRLVGPKS